MYERETTEERGKADFSGLALETINKLSSPRFNDVRVRFDGIGAETTIPQLPSVGMGVAVEDLEIFRSAEVLARIVPYRGRIGRKADQYVKATVGTNGNEAYNGPWVNLQSLERRESQKHRQ